MEVKRMEDIKIHVMHTGKVRVSPYLPFGGEDCNILKASGLIVPKNKWIWVPVSVYLIEHPKGKILVDAGWHRDMSPEGVFDKKAQIKSLNSRLLYNINQGIVEKGEAVNEQLLAKGIKPEDLDYILMTHLDCDHANGLRAVADAKNILVSDRELEFTTKKKPDLMIRYQSIWWKDTKIKGFDWNGTEGPVGQSYDLFRDGSIKMINIPGHCDGLCAVKITKEDGRFVLLFSDGGYATKSWKEMILPGICTDKKSTRRSLEWIREQSMDKNCVSSLANHDADVKPHIITL